jgi:hypothetical protein
MSLFDAVCERNMAILKAFVIADSLDYSPSSHPTVGKWSLDRTEKIISFIKSLPPVWKSLQLHSPTNLRSPIREVKLWNPMVAEGKDVRIVLCPCGAELQVGNLTYDLDGNLLPDPADAL